MKQLVTLAAVSAVLSMIVAPSPAVAQDGRPPSSGIEIDDLSVSHRTGLVQAQVTLHTYPPRRQPVEVRFEFAGETDEVRSYGFALNNPKTVSSRKPFPCNATEEATATIVSPREWAGVSTTAELTRSCSQSLGTPNLVPLSLEQTDYGETNSGATSIQVRVEVLNDSEYDMPDNEQGGNWWHIRLSGLNRSEQVRQALQAGEKHVFTARVTQPCWSVERDRYGEVTVTVDDRKNILEANENDNQATFRVERKRCRDAG